MSVIFLIVATEKQPRSAYRQLREQITQALLAAGFEFDPKNAAHRLVMYESTYTLFQLPHAPLVERDAVLRPEIQIEISACPSAHTASSGTIPVHRPTDVWRVLHDRR